MIRSSQFAMLEIGLREKDLCFKRKFIAEVHEVLERLLREAREFKEFEFKAEALLCIAFGLEHLLGEAFSNTLENILDEERSFQPELDSFCEELQALFTKHLHQATKGLSANN